MAAVQFFFLICLENLPWDVCIVKCKFENVSLAYYLHTSKMHLFPNSLWKTSSTKDYSEIWKRILASGTPVSKQERSGLSASPTETRSDQPSEIFKNQDAPKIL